jgi:hypothetical protein
MSADVWIGSSDSLYIDKSSVVVHRWARWFGRPECYEVAWTGGPEASQFMGLSPSSWLAVVDDFGNLVRVPS